MTGIRHKLREAAVILVALVVAIIALRGSARAPGDLSALDRGILTLISPAQAALSSIARGLGNAAGRYMDLVHVRGENETLRSENARLRADLLESRRAANEAGRLQRLLGLRDSVAAATLVARVIAIDASPYFRVARVQLDRGEGLVKPGMPVITPEGVVGRIKRVAGDTSEIQLSVDPASKIDVIVPRTGGRGMLRGKPGENGYRCSIEYLTKDGEAKEGDLVVTSGLGGFPRDLPVGHVSKVVKNSAGLYQELEVSPDVDFARLSEVLVVVAPPPAPDPDAGARARTLSPPRGQSVYR